MGILDDAIREHLDLKRKHGARDTELREIEDEAFGAGEQPDPFAAGNELFAESASPAGATAEATPPPDGIADLAEPEGGEEPTRLVEPEALRTPTESPSDPLAEPVSPPEGMDQVPGQAELPGQDEIPGQESFEDSLDSFEPPVETTEPPATEPPAPSESLEDLIAEEEPFPEDTAAAPMPETSEEDLPLDPEAPAPPEPESSIPEPPPPPPDTGPEPPPPPPDTGPEPPGRARGRVDVPTQEHPPPGETGGLPPLPESRPEPLSDAPLDDAPLEDAPLPDDSLGDEPAAEGGSPALYDFETDEDDFTPAPSDTDDDFEALGPAEEEAPYLEEEEPYAEEPVSDPGTEVRPALEDEEAYEGGGLDPEEDTDEGLWFEKGPPKDFDFEE